MNHFNRKKKFAGNGNLPAEEKVLTKILCICNDNNALSVPLNYLKKRDFDVKFVHSLGEGIKELTNFRPQILLLSWNLKGTDIKKAYPFLTQKFSAICFLIGEDDSNKTSSAMLACGLPNTLLYPMAGVSLYNRIQAALGRVDAAPTIRDSRHRGRNTDKAILAGREYSTPKKSEIPVDTEWHIRVGSQNVSNRIWESVVYKAGQPQYYYYKGEMQPENWLTATEEGPNDRAYIFKTDAPAGLDLLNSFQVYCDTNSYEIEVLPHPESYEIDLHEVFADRGVTSGEVLPREENTLASVKADDLYSMSIEALATAKSKHPTALQKSLSSAVEDAMKFEEKDLELTMLIDRITHLTVSVIKSDRYKGYLVSAQASNVSNTNFMQKVFQKLSQQMKNESDDLFVECESIEIKLDDISFKKWSRESAEFAIQFQIGNEEIVFAYLPVQELPFNYFKQDLVPVSIESLFENKLLGFDIYLHMPINQKYVLYSKNGSLFTKVAKEKLLEHKRDVIYLKESDDKRFFAYEVANHIEQSLQPEIITIAPLRKVD